MSLKATGCEVRVFWETRVDCTVFPSSPCRRDYLELGVDCTDYFFLQASSASKIQHGGATKLLYFTTGVFRVEKQRPFPLLEVIDCNQL